MHSLNVFEFTMTSIAGVSSQTSITVVNPAPMPTNVNEGDIDDIESLTLQELKKVHTFE